MSQILVSVIQLYSLLVVIRVLLSWFPPVMGTAFYQFLCELTDPYLNLFRRLIPPVGMIDFSPIIAILALEALAALIARGVSF